MDGWIKALALVLVTAGLAAPTGPSVVEMTPTMTFQPEEISVMVGEVVVWRNTAREPHAVNTVPENCRSQEGKEWIKVPDGAMPFFSGEIEPGEEFRVRFEVPGAYQYLCTFHEHASMRGTIVVHGAEVR